MKVFSTSIVYLKEQPHIAIITIPTNKEREKGTTTKCLVLKRISKKECKDLLNAGMETMEF